MRRITTFTIPTPSVAVTAPLVRTRCENGFVITEAEPQVQSQQQPQQKPMTNADGGSVRVHVSKDGAVKVHVGSGKKESDKDSKTASDKQVDNVKTTGNPNQLQQRPLTPKQQAYQDQRQQIKAIMKSSVPGSIGYKAVARIKAIQKFQGADLALRKMLVAHIRGEKLDGHLKNAAQLAKKLENKRTRESVKRLPFNIAESFPNHKGRPGQVGGSSAKQAGGGTWTLPVGKKKGVFLRIDKRGATRLLKKVGSGFKPYADKLKQKLLQGRSHANIHRLNFSFGGGREGIQIVTGNGQTIFESYPGHRGRKGQRGGSAAKYEGPQSAVDSTGKNIRHESYKNPEQNPFHKVLLNNGFAYTSTEHHVNRLAPNAAKPGFGDSTVHTYTRNGDTVQVDQPHFITSVYADSGKASWLHRYKQSNGIIAPYSGNTKPQLDRQLKAAYKK